MRVGYRVRFVAAAAAAGVVLSGTGPASADDSLSRPQECSTTAPTLEEAAMMATGCGVDVVVADLLDPWSSTTVRADGLVEWTSSIVAERAQTPDGQWVLVDASFLPAEEGRIGLAAPAVSMTFSDGSDGQPLAVVRKDGHELVYGMPFDLPAPQVDTMARQLVYPAVLEGVDLIVTVASDGSGFSEVLRIDSPQALDQPGLADLVIPVDLGGSLAWDQQADGGLRAVNDEGEAVFVAPPPVAWDSAADVLPEATSDFSPRPLSGGLPPLSSLLGRSDLPEVVGADPADLGELQAADRTQAPVDGDVVAPLDVEVTGDGDDLALRLDADLVEGAQFPLFVDPSMTGSVTGRAYVQSGWPSTAHWNDVTNYGVGRCDPALGCSGVNIYRSFFQFSTAGLGAKAGADILSATLTLYGQHSYSCTAAPVEVWHVGGVGAGTTWNAQPAWTSRQSSQTLAHKAACSNARDVAFAVTTAARSSADQNSDQLTLGVKAADESTNTGWKRYENPRLSVTYSRLPVAATSQKVNSVAACGSLSAPTWITSATPTFSFVVSDPDGGNVVGNLDVLTPGATTLTWDWLNAPALASGSTFTVALPAGKLAEHVVYEWRSGGTDTQGRSPGHGPMKSCHIKADLNNPAVPGVTATGVIENLVVAAPAAATFTISNASKDVVGYKVGFDMADPGAQPTRGANSNRNLFVDAVPANLTPGSHTLVVRAVDGAQRTSAIKTFKYSIARPSVAAYWTMDDLSATVADWSPSAVNRPEGTIQRLVFSPNPAREPGVYQPYGFDGDLAVKLTGSQTGTAKQGTAETAAPVVSSATAFSVAAYVKAGSGKPAGPGVVVSQDGTKSSSFALVQAATECPTGMTSCWAFTRSKTDDDTGAGTPVRVNSAAPVTPGQWQLLVARYTPGAGSAVGKMELTVCDEDFGPRGAFVECHTPEGVSSPSVTAVYASVPVPTWEAQGPLRVGMQVVKNAAGAYVPGNGFVGLVDDVRVYAGAVTSTDVIRIATGSDQAP